MLRFILFGISFLFSTQVFAYNNLRHLDRGVLDSCGGSGPYLFDGPASNNCHKWKVERSGGYVSFKSWDRGYLDACGANGNVYLNHNKSACSWFKVRGAGGGYVYLEKNGKVLDACGANGPYMYSGRGRNNCHKWRW